MNTLILQIAAILSLAIFASFVKAVFKHEEKKEDPLITNFQNQFTQKLSDDRERSKS